MDDSILYAQAKIIVCQKCGHIYNNLSPKEIRDLKNYYDQESAPTNLGSPDKTGDKTGNTGPLTMQRYNKLYDCLIPYIKNGMKILDCGCATGGFMDYLYEKGFKNLSGFEISETYKNQSKRWKDKIKITDMDQIIPFVDSSMDFLIADQVVEHLYKPRQSFKEARRVLKEGGYFCVSMPDASQYQKNYFFDFYWFILREHIGHFDIEHLKLLAAMEGFELVNFSRYQTPMMTEKMILPVLTAIFRRSEKTEMKVTKRHFELKKYISKYIKKDTKRLEHKKEVVRKLAKTHTPVYAWGIGREFMYIYEAVGLKKCKIAGLIDQNRYKQEKVSIDGIKIEDKSVLMKASKNSKIVISAIAHTKPIKEELKKMGYLGSILKL